METIEVYFDVINRNISYKCVARYVDALENSLNREKEFSEKQFSMYEKKYNENRKKCKESEYGIVRFYRKSMKSYRQRLKEIENYFERLEKVKQSIAT